MSYEIVSINLDKFSIINNRNKYLVGKNIHTLDIDQTDGSFITTEPLNNLGILTHYPSNPNNEDPSNPGEALYSTNEISVIKGTLQLNFPLDAKFDWARGLIWICDAGNNRVVCLKKSDYSLLFVVNSIYLPHSISINVNNGNVFIKSFQSTKNGLITEIDINGKIISQFIFPMIFPYSSLDIVRDLSWLSNLPLSTSISFDYTKNKLWWLSGYYVYMIDVLRKSSSTYDLSFNDFENSKFINIDLNSGNAIITASIGNSDYLVQMNKYNDKFLGSGYVEDIYASSSSSSTQSSSSSTWIKSSSSSSNSSYSSSSSSSYSSSSNSSYSSSSSSIISCNTIYSSGDNSHGQLGLGLNGATLKSVPTIIGSDLNWDKVIVGVYYSFGIKGGKLFAWGDNQYGQLGLSDANHRSSPVQVGSDTDWTDIIGGSELFTMGIRNERLYAWGNNFAGNLGDGTTNTSYSPVQIGNNVDWTKVSIGNGHAAAIKNGNLYTWGWNDYGQLGNSSWSWASSPTQVGALNTWTDVSAGYNFSLGIKNGELWAWGNNRLGSFGNGVYNPSDAIRINSPVQIGGETDWTNVYTGDLFSFGLRGGKLFAWGYTSLGLGDNNSRSSPVQVGAEIGWTHISVTISNTVFGLLNNNWYGWGDNGNGQLGLGDTDSRSSPVLIGNLSDWSYISGGGSHSLFLKSKPENSSSISSSSTGIRSSSSSSSTWIRSSNSSSSSTEIKSSSSSNSTVEIKSSSSSSSTVEFSHSSDPLIISGGVEDTVTYGGHTYETHTFTSDDTLIVSGSGNVEVLVVGGGGSAGQGTVSLGGSGGGGGGGIAYDAAYVLNDANVTVTVGVGGTVPGGVADGDPGDNSQFGSLIGYGGLGGERWIDYGYTNGGTSGAPQSKAGGGYTSGPDGAGGGGAGQVGENCVSGGVAGKGGNGLEYTISGTPTYYGGGGAGGTSGYNISGGLGGGGNAHADTTGDSGGVNTGGGGAGGYAGGASGSGGKGIVIVSLLIS